MAAAPVKLTAFLPMQVFLYKRHLSEQQLRPLVDSICTEVEAQKVFRFLHLKDKELAFGSLLLQKHIIHSLFNVPLNDISISRTKLGKPYCQHYNIAPAFNYNVSHDGQFVAMTFSQHCQTGIDIMETTRMMRLADLGNSFLPSERANITGAADPSLQLFRLWCVKEAYIKALGTGMSIEPGRIEVSNVSQQGFGNSHDISVSLDGKLQQGFVFTEFRVDENHIGCICKCPFASCPDVPASVTACVSEEDARRALQARDIELVNADCDKWCEELRASRVIGEPDDEEFYGGF